MLQDDSETKEIDSEPQGEEWAEEHQFVSEYAVFGWFKYIPIANRPANTVMLRLTNNEPDYRSEFQKVGDRTLVVLL
jgi:hypothetical protein